MGSQETYVMAQVCSNLHCGLGALPTLACVDLTNDGMGLEI